MLLHFEILKQLGIIKHYASNARTESQWVKHIQALNFLKTWGLENREPKLFGYDEVIESTTGRRAMSELNVEWVRFLPQASKLHLHILALVQDEHLADSIFRNPVFCRGMWTKVEKTFAIFKSFYVRDGFDRGRIDRDLTEYKLQGIPRTSIKFDPDLVATFQARADVLTVDFTKLSRAMQVAKLYGEGHNYTAIMQRLGLTEKKQIQRELQKICRLWVTGDRNDRDGCGAPP